MLVILADPSFARDVFHREARGLWSQAVALVLEKHGYLGLELGGPEALATPDRWRRHGCAIVTRLPDDAWSDTVVDRIRASRIPVLVEGPAPEPVRRALGVRHAAPAHPEMTVTTTDAELLALARTVSRHASGRVAYATSRPVPRDPGVDWELVPNVPLTPGQADAWRRPAWDAQEWSDLDADARVLAVWSRPADRERRPAMVARGNVIGCSLGLMTYLGQLHTSEPAVAGHTPRGATALGLEALLAGAVDLLHRWAGVPRPRLRPWPGQARWVLNVRHDVDRPQSSRELARVVDAHARTGTAATWYWRSRNLQPQLPSRRSRRWRTAAQSRAAVRVVAACPQHEIAHHTEMPWGGAADEQRLIEQAIGRRVLGTSAHGDPTCFRYQGAPNVLWAEHQGMLYTELIQQAHLHPHRYAALTADGDVRPLRVICLPHHHSFDRSASARDTHEERILEAPARFAAVQGLLQVMNHPDLHQPELFRTLAAFPRDDRLDWTAAQAADWWRRTHVLDNVRLETGDGALTIHAREPAEGLAVELLAPDGTCTVAVVDVSPDRPVTVRLTATGGGRPPRSTAGAPRAT